MTLRDKTLGQPTSSSVRLMLITGLAVIIAIASFADSFAIILGITAAGVAAGFVLVVLTGAAASLVRQGLTHGASMSSNSLSNGETI